MNKHKQPLSVSIQYKPNRFAQDSLLLAYGQLKPAFPRIASKDRADKVIGHCSNRKRGHS